MDARADARSLAKAINRHIRRRHIFEGGRTFGVDYSTWAVCYPHLAREFNQAAALLVEADPDSIRAIPIALLG